MFRFSKNRLSKSSEELDSSGSTEAKNRPLSKSSEDLESAGTESDSQSSLHGSPAATSPTISKSEQVSKPDTPDASPKDASPRTIQRSNRSSVGSSNCPSSSPGSLSSPSLRDTKRLSPGLQSRARERSASASIHSGRDRSLSSSMRPISPTGSPVLSRFSRPAVAEEENGNQGVAGATEDGEKRASGADAPASPGIPEGVVPRQRKVRPQRPISLGKTDIANLDSALVFEGEAGAEGAMKIMDRPYSMFEGDASLKRAMSKRILQGDLTVPNTELSRLDGSVRRGKSMGYRDMKMQQMKRKSLLVDDSDDVDGQDSPSSTPSPTLKTSPLDSPSENPPSPSHVATAAPAKPESQHEPPFLKELQRARPPSVSQLRQEFAPDEKEKLSHRTSDSHNSKSQLAAGEKHSLSSIGTVVSRHGSFGLEKIEKNNLFFTPSTEGDGEKEKKGTKRAANVTSMLLHKMGYKPKPNAAIAEKIAALSQAKEAKEAHEKEKAHTHVHTEHEEEDVDVPPPDPQAALAAAKSGESFLAASMATMRLKQQQEELNFVKTQVATLSSQRDAAVTERDELARRCNLLAQTLADRDRDLDDTRKDLAAKTATQAQAQQELQQALSKAAEERNSALQRAEALVRENRELKAMVDAQLRPLQVAHDQAQDRCRTLMADIEALRIEQGIKEGHMVALEVQLSSAREQVSQALAQRATMEAQLAETRAQLLAAETRAREDHTMASQYASRADEVGQLQRALDESKKARDVLQGQIDSLTAQLKKSEERVEHKRSKVESMRQALADTEQRLQVLQGKHDTTLTALAAAQALASHSGQQLDDAESMVRSLRTSVGEANKQLVALRSQLADMAAMRDSAEGRAKTLEADLMALRQSTQQLISESDEKRRAALDRALELQAKSESWESERRMLEAKVLRLENQARARPLSPSTSADMVPNLAPTPPPPPPPPAPLLSPPASMSSLFTTSPPPAPPAPPAPSTTQAPSPPVQAAASVDTVASKSLLQKQAKVSGSKATHSKKIAFPDMMVWLDAAAGGEIETIRTMLESGVAADWCNEEGLTAMHAACTEGHMAIVKLLLDHGANINATDVDGWTPLHAAACQGSTELVQYLVDHGANIDALAEGDTPESMIEDDEDDPGPAECRKLLKKAKETKNKATTVWALYDYTAKQSDELSIKRGDKLTVLPNKESEDWWRARREKDTKEGYVPSCYVGVCTVFN